MAHYPTPRPDPDFRAQEEVLSGGARPTAIPGGEGTVDAMSLGSDLAELAAKFSSEEGGNLSAELSADLALEVVLNEIVEQACLGTGANSAAVILDREGEWVCRASSGPSAPQLGERLGKEAGLIAECIRTRQIQRCENSEADLPSEIEASRNLAVRSLIALPLFQNGNLAGVFAAFAPQAFAFGIEEERTLEALCGYVLSSLAQVSEPVSVADETVATEALETPTAQSIAEAEGTSNGGATQSARALKIVEKADTTAASAADFPAETRALSGDVRTGDRAVYLATWVMAGVVLAIAALLTTAATERLLGHRRASRASGPPAAGLGPSTEVRTTGNSGSSMASNARGAMTPEPTLLHPRAPEFRGPASPGPTPGRAAESQEEGSLTVYEDGKEVFHLPASGPQAQPGNLPIGTERKPAPIEDHETASVNATEGSLVLRVEPEYPEQARQRKIEGPVVLDLWVGRDGAVQQVKVISGNPLLAGSAITAVKQWQFNPYAVDGRPAEMRSRVTLDFRLPH
jgi:TonB family protein